MPSRMKEEAFLYFVYGANCLIQAQVASSMRKVTIRTLRIISYVRFLP